MLRWLFLRLRDAGFHPILLDGTAIHKTLQFDSHIKKVFSNEIQGEFDAWMQLESKVAIIDDFNHNISPNILPYLESKFVMTIVAVDDEEFLLYYKDDSNFADYSVLSIGQLTSVKQEQLIRRWSRLSHPLAEPGDEDDLQIDKMESSVNNVITSNRIVPRYPFYVLSILQSLADFMPTDYRITAYGPCCQALVVAQLLKKN